MNIRLYLVEPVDHLHRLRAGEELLNVEVIGFRGPNLVCRGPEDLQLEEVPNDTGSGPRPPDRGNRGPSSPPPQPIPSLGLLRDDHWRRMRSRPPCVHYPHGTCNQGDMCSFKHEEWSAPPGWRFRDLSPQGDVRGIPTQGRRMCARWRDGACKYEYTCRCARFRRQWEPEDASDFKFNFQVTRMVLAASQPVLGRNQKFPLAMKNPSRRLQSGPHYRQRLTFNCFKRNGEQ